MLRWLPIFLLLAPLGSAWAASSNRYALVIGNNIGRTADAASELVPLRHAERDARELATLLATYGQFDASRVVVVTHGDRAAILEAAQRLIEIRKRDRALGEVSSLFALFYSGHGLRGKLLTPGEPLSGVDLGRIFQEMDADFSLGFFDACDAGALQAKGARYTGPANPLAELPEEVLRAEGAIWLVSSKAAQVSYEDPALGGVFTHFFKRAFLEAETDRVGISLERMWEYTSQATHTHVERHGLDQTPQKQIEKLRLEGPIYFSFPKPRAARLRLAPETHGTFILRYPGSALVERVVKAKGAPLTVAVPSGPLRIRYPTRTTEDKTIWQATIAEGETLFITKGEPPTKAHVPGFSRRRLVGKGEEMGMVLETLRPSTEISLALDYSYHPTVEHLVGLQHSLGLGADGASGRWTYGGRLRYGFGSRARPEVEQHSLGLGVEAGYGLVTDGIRLDAVCGVSADSVRVHYNSGHTDARARGAILADADRNAHGFTFRPGLRAWWALELPVQLFVRLGVSTRNAPGMAVGDNRRYWSTGLDGSVGVLWPLL